MTIQSFLNIPKKVGSAIAWVCAPEKLDYVQTPAKPMKFSLIRKIFQAETLDELPPQKIKSSFPMKWLFSGEALDEISDDAKNRDSFLRWLCKSELLDSGSESPSSCSKQHVKKE